MIQQILTIIIVAIAAGITVYKLVKSFSPQKKDCSQCHCETSNCQLLELKDAIDKAANKSQNYPEANTRHIKTGLK